MQHGLAERGELRVCGLRRRDLLSVRVLPGHRQRAGQGGITHQRQPRGPAVWVEPMEAGRRSSALHQVLALQLRDSRLNSGLHPSQLPAQLIGARESPSLPLQLAQQAFHAAEASSAGEAQVQPTPSSSAEPSASAGFQLDLIVAKQVVFNLVEQLQQGGHMSGSDIQRLVRAFEDNKYTIQSVDLNELSTKLKNDDWELDSTLICMNKTEGDAVDFVAQPEVYMVTV